MTNYRLSNQWLSMNDLICITFGNFCEQVKFMFCVRGTTFCRARRTHVCTNNRAFVPAKLQRNFKSEVATFVTASVRRPRWKKGELRSWSFWRLFEAKFRFALRCPHATYRILRSNPRLHLLETCPDCWDQTRARMPSRSASHSNENRSILNASWPGSTESSVDRWSSIRTYDRPAPRSDRTSPVSRSVCIPRRTRSRRIAGSTNNNHETAVLSQLSLNVRDRRALIYLAKNRYDYAIRFVKITAGYSIEEVLAVL